MKIIISRFMATSVFTHTVFTVSKNEMESVRAEGMACPIFSKRKSISLLYVIPILHCS